jgi:hypothetical protein
MTDENKNLQPKPQDVLDKVLQMSDDDILPWEEVVLPSLGQYYDNKLPGGIVKVRPMGLAADKVLATQRLAQSGKSIDYLFKKCVQLASDFDSRNLLTGDRIFLLYYLRGITHGNDYEFVVKCGDENCGKENIKSYDLNKLIGTIKRPSDGIGSEPFKVVLPHMSKITGTEFWVKVRLMRGYDLETILNNRTTSKKIGKNVETIDDSIEEHLAMLIVNAMGSEDRRKIKTLIGKLHSSDTATIRQFLKDNTPGIETNIEVDCEFCGNNMKIELPITESFFRPTITRNNRE